MGGHGVANPDDPEVREVAEFATKMYNSMSNSIEQFEKGRIVSATKQVVAGKNFVLDMELVGNSNTVFIRFEVFVNLSGEMELSSQETYFTMRPKHTSIIQESENIVGGYHQKEAENAEVRSAAVEFTRTMPETVERNAVMVVCKAETQVVNGINYRLTIGFGDCNEPNTRSGVVYKPFNGDYKVSSRN